MPNRRLALALAMISLAASSPDVVATPPPTAPPPDLTGIDLRPLFQISRSRIQQYVGPVLPPPTSEVDETITVTRGGATFATLYSFLPWSASANEITARVVRARATPDQLRDLRRIASAAGIATQVDCVLRNDQLVYDWAFRGTTRYTWYGRAARTSFTVLHRDRGSGPVDQPACPRAFFELDWKLWSWLSWVTSNPDSEILWSR